jgi:hypothetical protein
MICKIAKGRCDLRGGEVSLPSAAMIHRLIRMLVLALGLLAPAAWGQPQSFDRDELVIESESGAHRFAVELAISAEQRAQGLMFRRRLAADAGMLFLYPDDRVISMWMKNTLIPLDMLFIGADGRIVQIAERAVPGSMAMVSSDRPARAVLELNGGTAARLRIKPGDRVLYRSFGTAD